MFYFRANSHPGVGSTRRKTLQPFPALTSRWHCRALGPGWRLDLDLRWAGRAPWEEAGEYQVAQERGLEGSPGQEGAREASIGP